MKSSNYKNLNILLAMSTFSAMNGDPRLANRESHGNQTRKICKSCRAVFVGKKYCCSALCYKQWTEKEKNNNATL